MARLAGVDIRTLGSGNIGATNVWRAVGPRYAIPVILLDIAKGFVPALAATLVAGHVAGALAGGAAMLGHWRPIFLRFAKGGKMVATCGGALFGLAPLVGLIGVCVWLLVFALTRYASVSSILAAASLPVTAPSRRALAGARLFARRPSGCFFCTAATSRAYAREPRPGSSSGAKQSARSRRTWLAGAQESSATKRDGGLGGTVVAPFLGRCALSRARCEASCASPGPVARDLPRRAYPASHSRSSV